MKKTLYLLIGCVVVFAAASSLYWTTKAGEQAPPRANAEVPNEEDAKLRALSSDSELIITGRCVETRSEWVENNRILVTLAKIEVAETLKGSSVSTVTVVLPGGADINRKFPVAMTYAGAPNITEGEEVFLFLTAESLVPGGYAVNGFADGKFSIIQDDDGNKLIARGPIRGTVKTERGMARSQQPFEALSEFRNKVKGYAGR